MAPFLINHCKLYAKLYYQLSQNQVFVGTIDATGDANI